VIDDKIQQDTIAGTQLNPNLARFERMNCLNATRPLNRTRDSSTQSHRHLSRDCKLRRNAQEWDWQMSEFKIIRSNGPTTVCLT